MKRFILLVLMCVIIVCICLFGLMNNKSKFYKDDSALYVHGVLKSNDDIAWQKWEYIDKYYYFFLPSSVDDTKIEVYNSYSDSIYINNVEIKPHKIKSIKYDLNKNYKVKVKNKIYTLKLLKSNAEVTLYINNDNADGKGTDLITYIHEDKNNYSSASSVIITKDDIIDKIRIKKIKGRGNSSWEKSKKSYNITFKNNVDIAGIKGKKFTLICNYMDDTLSRNRITYDISNDVGIPYSVNSRYVDLYVNYEYKGSYLITDRVKSGKNNLINDLDNNSYLLELSMSVEDDEVYFDTDYGQKVIIKNDNSNIDKIKTKFNEFYDSLKK